MKKEPPKRKEPPPPRSVNIPSDRLFGIPNTSVTVAHARKEDELQELLREADEANCVVANRFVRASLEAGICRRPLFGERWRMRSRLALRLHAWRFLMWNR